jgi:aminopeptidase
MERVYDPLPVTPAERIERLADLTIGFGANVQPGQIVAITSDVGHEALARALATAAYKRGAHFVDVEYFDPYVKHARVEYAAEDTLEFVPSWYGQRLLELGELHASRILTTGLVAPGLFDDVDPARAGRDVLPRLKESGKVVGDRTTNWCIVPFPTAAWGQKVHPELDEEEALAKLWDEIAHVCRLEDDDPVTAWRERIAATARASERLNQHRFDALHYEGPGIDLTVGLLPTSLWANALFSTVDGIEHLVNIPTEEVFTSPDPQRADGVVTATKPLVFSDGSAVEGLRVRFEGGRAVEIDAEHGAENLRSRCAKDEGGTRLGEVALVDGAGRIGQLGTIFHHTLLDENAASHLALGQGFGFAVGAEDRDRVNTSAVHYDFMIGSPDVEVTGTTVAGERVPVLRRGEWQI